MKPKLEQKLLSLLSKNQVSITTAESCTGGLVAANLCDISGISAYFEEGYITYSEAVKIKLLEVLPETIENFGVVSLQTAEEMAKGAAKKANTKCAVATTGVAGPTGGTKENPVGTVCFAWAIEDSIYSKKMLFEGNRNQIRMHAANYALEMLCEYLELYFEKED